MKVASPMLLPLLRSRTQGDVIARLMLDPEREHTASQIAAELGVSLPTVMRETDRLVDAGLLRATKRGNTRYLRVRTDNPVFKPLADLMAVTFGPVPVLRDLLAGIDGVEEAFVYGSWAARYHGDPGPVPGDIDLLVIGEPDRHALGAVVEVAERRLHREVNVRRISRSGWDSDEGSFTSTIAERPRVWVRQLTAEDG